jgi:hypothetical protein
MRNDNAAKVAESIQHGGQAPQVFNGRKVRAPQDIVVGNAHRSKDQGECNRKQTAGRGGLVSGA